MAREFVKEHGVTYPTLMDVDGKLSATYEVSAFPTIALIDKKGVLRYLQSGFDEDAVTAQIKTLLAE